MWWLAIAPAMAGDPTPEASRCDPSAQVRSALAQLLSGALDQARVGLQEAERAFGCGASADPASLARYWLVEGALLSKSGDESAAKDSFSAARRVAPDLWLPDLGPSARLLWESALAPDGAGELSLEPPPGVRPVWVDGALVSGSAVPAGLHLVQIGGGGPSPSVEFAAIVWVDAGITALVRSGLPELAPPDPEPDLVVPPSPVPVPVPGPDRSSVRASLHALVGVSGAAGEALQSGSHTEPRAKVAAPLELGVGLRAAPMFFRLQLGGAWLLSGRYLAQTDSGPLVLPVRADLALGAGATVGKLDLGLCGGVQWPSRLAGRLLLGISAGPARAELRPGLNLPTQRSVEPAGELLVGVGF